MGYQGGGQFTALAFRQMTIFAVVKKLAVLGILFFSHLIVKGQELYGPWHVSAGVGGGFIIPHHPDMKYLVEGHVLAATVNMYKVTDGRRDWHHYFNFPSWGLSFNAFNLRSDDIGAGFSALIFLDAPLNPKRSVGLKMGIGAAYINKPFDLDDNFHNTAIGSHINAAIVLEGYVSVPLSRKFFMRPGIALHHVSNGAFQMPNSGINMPFLKLTVCYLGSKAGRPERLNPEFVKPPNQLLLGTTFGAKEILPIGGPLYPVVNVFAIWKKRFSPKSSYGAEGGINYNQSLSFREESTNDDRYYDLRAYIAGMWQLHFEPFGIRLQAGTYLFPAFASDGSVFFRYHLIYELPRIEFIAGLKSHFAKADNIEVGAAYRLKK